MNAVEIEEAVSELVDAPFDPDEFPYAFLAAFGNKNATIKRLRAPGKGSTNKSDVPGGVLQRNNIHLAVTPGNPGTPGSVGDTFKALLASPATQAQKAKYVLATDGRTVEAENLVEGETLACDYKDLANHFGFFLPLAGITTVKQIRENAFDIKATGRLNRLYVELLKENPDWDTAARREELNHFFARLIFCFFAEDTNIFPDERLFTATIEQMTARDGSDTHKVLAELFRAMNIPTLHEGKPDNRYREAAKIPRWAGKFPYVNGGLFSGSTAVPRFSKIARSYLIHIGGLDWKQITPDIFGSMIQAVADDEERGALGQHYTSRPNILKVLNPLFLDDLREKLEEAGDNPRKLLNLRNRMARIRLFDPACGSGNFLVIAYKELRALEAEINKRRGEANRSSDIPLTNFRGIEIRHFSCEVARLALIIAKYQCDVCHRGHKLALADLLPLEKANWITHGNALCIDWLSVCPPAEMKTDVVGTNLYYNTEQQATIDFENEGGETYICGNPPYVGSRNQTAEQKRELREVLEPSVSQWRSLDYVAGWLVKAVNYLKTGEGAVAFVSTNSICQGSQVPVLWKRLYKSEATIAFAHLPFKWSNLAANNAGVSVIIVGLRKRASGLRTIYELTDRREPEAREVQHINAYLVPGDDVFVEKRRRPLSLLFDLERGCAPVDDGNYLLDQAKARELTAKSPAIEALLRPASGGEDFIRGKRRFLIKVSDPSSLSSEQLAIVEPIARRVTSFRKESRKDATRRLAAYPFRFGEEGPDGDGRKVFVPNLHSERRDYLTVGLMPSGGMALAPNFIMDTPDVFPVAVLSSRLHLVWIGTVCGKLETRYRYSNTLGWNTFPVPTLTEQNKSDLTRCAEDILLAREAHFPATIADLYDPDKMPADLREAHDRNDETLERIYIGRRFKNDTERLEKLFELYTQMTAKDKDAKTK